MNPHSKSTPTMSDFEVFDARSHLNRLPPHWEERDLADSIQISVAAIDAVGIDSVLIDERRGGNILVDDRHVERLVNGAPRYHTPFGELVAKRYPAHFACLARLTGLASF